MDEWVQRMYLKEEDFLEGHFQTVEAMLPAIDFRWKPNFQCNDAVRWDRNRRFACGQLDELVFESAVIFHDKNGFSSMRIYLQSSTWLLVTRLTWANGELVVQKMSDGRPKTMRRPIGQVDRDARGPPVQNPSIGCCGVVNRVCLIGSALGRKPDGNTHLQDNP